MAFIIPTRVGSDHWCSVANRSLVATAGKRTIRTPVPGGERKLRRCSIVVAMANLFDLVLASGFYDGAEQGLAFKNDGSAVAFWSIADSPLRLFRAYYFRPLLNLDAARELAAKARSEGKQFAFLDGGVEECATQAGPVNQVGVGQPYLDWLHVAPATNADLDAILASDFEGERYRRAHGLVKRFRAALDGP